MLHGCGSKFIYMANAKHLDSPVYSMIQAVTDNTAQNIGNNVTCVEELG